MLLATVLGYLSLTGFLSNSPCPLPLLFHWHLISNGGMVTALFLTLEAGSTFWGVHAQGGGGTYNVHDGQHVLFHVPAPVVGHHHLVSHHQGLHVALSADGALQAWLATLCFIAEGPGRWRFQGAQPPRPPLPWFLIWMDNFWSFCCLLELSESLSDGSSGCQTPPSLALGSTMVRLPHCQTHWSNSHPVSHDNQHDHATSRQFYCRNRGV